MKLVTLLLAATFLFGACSKDDEDSVDQDAIDRDLIVQYIADNNLDAQSTESGLYYVFDDPGSGQQATASSTVRVVYKGYLVDGTVFDQATGSGATFNLAGTIQGWREGIPLFREGGEGILLIPSKLGYGSQAVGSIPPNSVLIFDIDLKDVSG